MHEKRGLYYKFESAGFFECDIEKIGKLDPESCFRAFIASFPPSVRIRSSLEQWGFQVKQLLRLKRTL